MLIRLFLLFLLTASFSACDFLLVSKTPSEKNKTALQGKTMGTRYTVSVIHSQTLQLDTDTLKLEIDSLLHNLNQQVSTYIPNSQISEFNSFQSKDWFPIGKDFFTILENAQKISQISDGAFDISVSPLIEAWGFGTKEQLNNPNEKEISKALNNIGFQHLQLQAKSSSIKKTRESLQIDLSAIAKGYAVDKISELLLVRGFANHLVEIGGELRVRGKYQHDEFWYIAIEQPDTKNRLVSNALKITNKAVATSGDYRNYFIENGVRRSHIINPKTGYPITHKLASVTILDDSTMLADAHATAIMVMGELTGKKYIQEQNLNALMIIRENNKFKFWQSSDVFD